MAAAPRNPGDWFSEQGAPPTVGPTPGGVGPAPVFGGSFGTGPVPPGVYTNQTPPPQGTGTNSGGQYRPYSDQALQDILHKYSPDNAGVRQADAEIQRTFGPGVVQLLDHPERLDKFVTPTGTFDTVVGAGGANPSWGWIREGGGGTSGGGAGTLGGLSGVGVTPQGMAFVNRVMGDMGAVGPLLGDPMAGRPITDDPSFGFRMNEGAKALERSAAARGTLLTGGAAKAMQRYAQDVASTEYQNSYNRRAAEQQNNYNRLAGVADFMGGQQQNQFGRYYQTAGLGLNATNNAQNNASGYAQNIGNAQIGVGSAQAGSTAAQGGAQADLYTTLGNAGGLYANNFYNNRATMPTYNGSPRPTIGIPAGTNAGMIGGAYTPNPYAGF